MFNLKQSMDWKELLCVASWHIWKLRNIAVFEHKMIKPFSAYDSFYVDYVTTNHLLQGSDEEGGNYLDPSSL